MPGLADQMSTRTRSLARSISIRETPAGSKSRCSISLIAASSMTIRRASVYFSPVSAIRARTCLLNALSSVTPVPHGDAARALIAWLGSDPFP
jgi:hypothetical protein